MASNIILRKDKHQQAYSRDGNANVVSIPSDPLNGEYVFRYGGENSDLRLHFTMVNGKKEGVSRVVRKDGSVYMEFTYVNDVKEGEVVKYNEQGSVVMKGNMKNGREVGLFKEYDDNGELIWIGTYQNEKRHTELKKSETKEGFYEERTIEGTLLSLSHYDETTMEKDGVSYEYKSGKLAHVFECVKGQVTRVIMEFNGKQMCEYDTNGRKRYEGEYGGSVETGFHREGKGVEYDAKEAAVYVGAWHDGKRNGYGTEYENSAVIYNGLWKDGKPDKPKDTKKTLPIVQPSQSSQSNRLSLPAWITKVTSFKYWRVALWSAIGLLLLLIIIIVVVAVNGANRTTFKKCKDLTSFPAKKLASATKLVFRSGFECEQVVDLSRFVHCESIEIEANAMTQITQLDISKLVSLKTLSVGDNSCGAVNEVVVEDTIYNELTSISVGSHAFNALQIIIADAFPSLTAINVGSDSLNALTVLPTSSQNTIRSLTVGSSSLNKIPELPLNAMTSLRSLKVGPDSFASLSEMELSGLNQIAQLDVKEGSFGGVSTLTVKESNWRILSGFGFQQDSSGYALRMDHHSPVPNVKTLVFAANLTVNLYKFEIDGLEQLESLTVDSNNFDGGGQPTSLFRLENCPSLRTMLIQKGCFMNYTTVVFKNLTSDISMSMHDTVFVNSEVIKFVNVGFKNFILGEESFQKVRTLVFDGMQKLKSLKIGSKSFSHPDNTRKEGDCHITNCPILGSFEVDSFAFDDYTELELANNPSLVLFTLGDWCFNSAHSVSLIGTRWVGLIRRFAEARNHHIGQVRIPRRLLGHSHDEGHLPLQLQQHSRRAEWG